MVLSEDLINFDLIETHKENIQQLPGGRSAKQLVSILSPKSLAVTGAAPTLDETKTLNDAIRQEYEIELLSAPDSDDPLDIYDRYVKWTLNAYPSAQATTQSQLLPLLERATKAFLTSTHYKNDPRYLKLWLHYIRLFSDAPRETFAFLARHQVGENLGLFYEEFAAWLEGAGRWNQADEVFKMGIDKEARPAERLLRKYNQFQQRYEARTETSNEPSSPALPTVRHALAAKMDPFASTPRAEDPQSQRPGPGGNTARPKSGKPKMAIFSDADNEAQPQTFGATNGWDSIGSMKDRKKENMIEARSWTGETLKAGKKVGTATKMEVFKDPKIQIDKSSTVAEQRPGDVINPRTGRIERCFVDLSAIYPGFDVEYSFEELRAIRRGWMSYDWSSKPSSTMHSTQTSEVVVDDSGNSAKLLEVDALADSFQHADIHDTSTQSMVGMPDQRPGKPKKVKVREIRQETQTVKTRLDSPTSRKVKRKGSSEPTMTFHSKAATNDIYDMFNQSKKPVKDDDTHSGDESEYGDDTYSTAGESANTGLISGANSEFGDDTTRSFGNTDHTSSQPESVSPWSEFTTSKHVPKLHNSRTKDSHNDSEGLTGIMDASQDQTFNTESFDTQAIAALAGQNFEELNTKIIAQLAGDDVEDDDDGAEDDHNQNSSQDITTNPGSAIAISDADQLSTPVEELLEDYVHVEVKEKPRYVPIPPEDYEPTPMRPYRDPAVAAQNKLPFMTPIAERTESSLAPSTIYQDKECYDSKTPSRSAKTSANTPVLQIDQLLLSSPAALESETPCSSKRCRPLSGASVADEDTISPIRKHVTESPITEHQNIPFPVENSLMTRKIRQNPPANDDVFQVAEAAQETETMQAAATKRAFMQAKSRPSSAGPIIPDLQCNPVDPAVQQQILKLIHPSPSTYSGFFEHDAALDQYEIIKKYAKKERSTKASPRKSPKKTPKDPTRSVAPVLDFPNAKRIYAVKKELGTGAYAAVYLVDSFDPKTFDVEQIHATDDLNKYQSRGVERHALEAMKSESPAISLAWEYHILHLLKSRLGLSARTLQSIVTAHECHLYRDECYLVLDYHSQGTILDLVNKVRADNSRAGKAVEGLDETVAMWLSIEVLRTMEDLHKFGILHGDLKIDNCLTRFEPSVELTSPFNRYGNDGWDSKGMMLIDFGRGIDIKNFKPEARFVADWKAEETDCAEIREARPWKWEIDLFGAAGIIHSLLFGKYIETVASSGGGLGQKKEWKLKENFKRYWEKELWGEVFHVLINGGGRDAAEIKKDVARVRSMMEEWLEKEGERGGRDLRASIRRCERLLGVSSASSSSRLSGR